jgi:MraZ protein
MSTFIGEYECKIDAKGRLTLPAGLLKQFPDDLKQRFVLSKNVFEKCLLLNPMDAWGDLIKKLSTLNPRFNKQHNEFVRRFTDGNTLLEVDASNRILLPKHLTDYATIGTDIILTCNLDSIEIWDATAYKAKMNTYNADDFATLAEQVMGSANSSTNPLI